MQALLSPSVSLRVVASMASVPKRKSDPKKRVVVTGMGLVSVFDTDPDRFYTRLLEGESGLGLIDRFDTSGFPTRFADQIRGFNSEGYIEGNDDRRMDDCWRYCLVAGKKALDREHRDRTRDPRPPQGNVPFFDFVEG